MKLLRLQGTYRTIIHGSVARGDVDKHSDVDISILDPVSTFVVECALESPVLDLQILEKRISMATPNHAIKGHVILSNGAEITIPLCPLKQREVDFYKFSGYLTIMELEDEDQLIRVSGINKRLLVIEPVAGGYWEDSIVGKEHEMARKLRINVDVIKERVRVLSQRDDIGRTGQFISQRIPVDFQFETILKELQDRNPAVRRRLRNK